jgi:two-component system phosphate regulon response regulator PhoB
MQKKILVIEDEHAIGNMIRMALESEDYRVAVAENGREAKAEVDQELPDLMLVDWMLPGTSGLELIRGYRRQAVTQRIPVIMVTAKTEEEDILKGLEAGADDYITKPFSTRELIARINALLRRADSYEEEETAIEVGKIVLNPASHELTIDGESVDAGPTEYRLLKFLMQHPDRVYSRSQLLDYVWGENVYIEERTVDVHILRLRKLLRKYGVADLLQTVRGSGYRLSARKQA